ncbi:hypothetical protein AMTR_s00005p00247650 [Amborella trichopoda]|uniref:Ribonuclease H2 subunit B n=1 Tax=Amborella trichopoda TaxID=13333 RepID=W1PAF0_AMBTC|nr:hypothetical protein AMTR_s00005p00247650 [Amborella trichopoda]
MDTRGSRNLHFTIKETGKPSCYLFTDGLLQELHWFKQSYGSWFIGDYICEDGGIYVATPVDPVFILLPLFHEARMKKGDELGKFRQVDDIMFVDGYPGYRYLLPVVSNSLQAICEVKEVGSEIFCRLDDSKVVAWLHCKVNNLKLVLPTLDKNYAVRDEKDTLRDAVSLLGEYLSEEPWIRLLCSHLSISLDYAVKSDVIDILPIASESTLVQDEKGRTRTGTGRQSKKKKTETGSLNIKDMFRKASRSGN